MSGFRDDAPPWSFFIPIVLAVIVGVLAADAIRYAVLTVFAGHDEVLDETAQPDATEPALSPTASDAGTPSDAEPDGAGRDAADDHRAEPGDAPPPPPGAADADPGEADADRTQAVSSALQELPGPLSARRDGHNTTCINGTVAYRSGNGWEQSLENDAPLRCTATSP